MSYCVDYRRSEVCIACGRTVWWSARTLRGSSEMRVLWRDSIGLSDNSNWRCPAGKSGRQPHVVGEPTPFPSTETVARELDEVLRVTA